MLLVTVLLNVAEWNLMNSHGGNEIPKIADFLGMTITEHQSGYLVAFNYIQPIDANYLFSTDNLWPAKNTLVAAVATSNIGFDFQQNANHNLQSLTQSMGSSGNNSCACETGGKSSNATATTAIIVAVEAAPRRTLDTFWQRTSIYRGVTRHRLTGRYEAHLWDNSCRREGQSRKGHQDKLLNFQPKCCCMHLS
ncbi:hypothetical protein Ancab_016215 [Ancistrocladus abbreviatus]